MLIVPRLEERLRMTFCVTTYTEESLRGAEASG
jgi:hypothetical protein